MSALQMAMKTAIQSFLGLTPGVDVADDTCDITPGGMPKANSGQIFYGIVGDEGGFNNDADASLDERYDLDVIITLRSDYCPPDRAGVELFVSNGTNNVDATTTIGLWPRAQALRAKFHMNYTVMNDANTNAAYGIGAGANGFDEPLKFRGARGLGSKGPDWFMAQGDRDWSGVAVRVSFGGARRVQKIEAET